MNEIVDSCDKCGKSIPTGNPYFCFQRSIEQIEPNPVNNEYEANVLHAEILIALCVSCGHNFDHDALINLMRLLPGVRERVKN